MSEVVEVENGRKIWQGKHARVAATLKTQLILDPTKVLWSKFEKFYAFPLMLLSSSGVAGKKADSWTRWGWGFDRLNWALVNRQGERRSIRTKFYPPRKGWRWAECLFGGRGHGAFVQSGCPFSSTCLLQKKNADILSKGNSRGTEPGFAVATQRGKDEGLKQAYRKRWRR